MKNNSNSQWAAMSVWGYKDSPFTWQIPHYSYLNGENDYTFLLLPRNNTCYTFQLYGSHHYI
jgi:hypothetical protein